jgi:hypothetical protein
MRGRKVSATENLAAHLACRALITRGFREHAAAMEDVARALSKNERLTLLRLLKKLGKSAEKMTL